MAAAAAAAVVSTRARARRCSSGVVEKVERRRDRNEGSCLRGRLLGPIPVAGGGGHVAGLGEYVVKESRGGDGRSHRKEGMNPLGTRWELTRVVRRKLSRRLVGIAHNDKKELPRLR